MKETYENISIKLKGLRAEKGYSHEEMAEKLGVHRETFRKYENAPNTMEVGTFLKILNIYGVSAIYFFDLIYGNLPKSKEET